MKKNLFALFLVMAMLLSLVAGCSGDTKTTSSTASQPATDTSAEQAPETTPETASETGSAESHTSLSAVEPATEPSYTLPISEDPLTYSMWTTYAPFAAELVNTETLEGMLVLDALQEVTNIHFDFVAANGAAEQDNFNLMIAAGDYTDILSSMEFYNTGLEGAVEEGIVMDLADILPEKCPTYWSYLSSNTTTLMRGYTDSGYMPAIMVLTPEVGQEVVGPVLRQDWLDAFGMEMPKTYDELYTYIEKANQEYGAVFEMTASNGIMAELAYGLNIEIGGYTVEDGKVLYGPAQESFKDYLKFMNRLYENALIPQDFFSDSAQDLSSQARLDFGLGTNSLLAVAANNTSDIMMNVTDDRFEMAVLPYVSTDGKMENHVGPDTLTNTVKDPDPWCFNADLKDIDPLLEMVEYLFSPEGYLLSNYGVEGESYTLDENGEPQYTDLVINNPDGLSYFFASYVYATNAASGFFPYINDMEKTYYDFNDNQWQIYEDLKTLSDCAYNYPSYATMTTEESGKYTSVESDLSTYAESAILEFIVGSVDIDGGFDAYINTLHDMNLQDMIDLKQAAYDRAMDRVADFTA